MYRWRLGRSTAVPAARARLTRWSTPAAPAKKNRTPRRVQRQPSSRRIEPTQSAFRRQDAEFVALRVGQHHPRLLTLADVDMLRAQSDYPIDLGLLVVGTEVQMDAVLDDLVVGHCDKQPVGTGAGRSFEDDIAVLVDIGTPAQHLCPPSTESVRVVGVDADLLERQTHFSTPAHSGPCSFLAAILTRVRLRAIRPTPS